MHGKEEDGFVLLKIDDGEDLMQCLCSAIELFDIESGFVLMGVGMLKDAEVGYFDGREYRKKRLDEPHELLSLQGSISTAGGLVIHLHCSLASPNNSVVGGHLFSAKACVVNEIVIKKVKAKLSREPEPRTGLKVLRIE